LRYRGIWRKKNTCLFSSICW